jgi:hypothetical protein
MTRDEQLAKLTALNVALRRHNCEPLFSDEVVAGLTTRGLKAAAKLTEDELMRVTAAVLEQ